MGPLMKSQTCSPILKSSIMENSSVANFNVRHVYCLVGQVYEDVNKYNYGYCSQPKHFYMIENENLLIRIRIFLEGTFKIILWTPHQHIVL